MVFHWTKEFANSLFSLGLVRADTKGIAKRVSRRVVRFASGSKRIARMSGYRDIEQEDVTWIFGAGRSGSTWLTEMIGDLGAITWPEPYFGMLYHFVAHAPQHLDRRDSFFNSSNRTIWTEQGRQMFLEVARRRYGRLAPNQPLVVKDINAPAICPFFSEVFPRSNYLLLIRDPFDALDSQLDMQKPGAWNEEFGKQGTPEEMLKLTVEHVKESFETAIKGYDDVAPSRRLMIKYRDLLNDGVATMRIVMEFVGAKVTDEQIAQVIEKHRFENNKVTGAGQFRRFGKPGVWRESGNFTPEVLALAQERLGPLRKELGYED